MKKGTLIRNDAPHAVKMPEGSNVAARKVKKTAAEPAPQEPPTSPVARKSVNKKAIDMPPVKVPESIAVKPKPKPKPKVRPKAQAQPLETLAAKLLPAAAHVPTPLPVPLDEAVLWEKDNPVKSRMAQLKARNAILEEQLQRLQSPFQARGKRP